MNQYKPEKYNASEIEVSVPMQKMINKTAERLCEAIALDWNERDLLNLELIATLGFDSSSGHTNAQQKCENSKNETFDALQYFLLPVL